MKWLLIMVCSPGSDECPFPYPPDESKDWSPDSPVASHLRPQRVHSGTQTDGPQLSTADPEAGGLQPCLLVPAAPTLNSCPSPVPQRKVRHCAKWENRSSVALKPVEPEEENKPTYESLETVSVSSPNKCKIHHSYWASLTCSVSFPGQPEAPESQRDTT